ncbi:unnamed protein product [Caenorhabditis angaria]|uniref:F-box domain-containing protein n=1 Tax=Caenorhabditis angaria TaxID=860376 RepID=A0A9P1ND27_9PELO|nr:unnamed protein product [Caenorhabditis angaria]
MSEMDISTIDCENKKTTTITDIPLEILEKIYTYLESIDIVRFRSVSKQIQEFLDSLDKTESLNDSNVISVGLFGIKNNNIEVMNDYIPKYKRDPVKYPPKAFAIFPITGIRQLNWYRPIWLTYENSTILESSLDLTDFLENVQLLTINNILNTTDPIVRERRLENFCVKLQNMLNMGTFYCDDENLTEEELVKIIQSLKYNPTFNWRGPDSIWLTLNGNIPFYKKSILSTILHKTQKFGYVYIDSDHAIDRDFDEADYEGIEMFLKTKRPGSDCTKVLNLKMCPESVCDKLIELSHKWFGHGETEPGIIKNGQNTLIFCDNDD